MVDTGHSRLVDNGTVQNPSTQSAARCPRTVPSRTGSCPPGKHSTLTRGGRLSGGGGQSVDVGQLDDSVNYVMDVKRALASQPDVYRQFVEVVQRYHDQRHDQLDLQSIRQIVSLLRTRPQLVLSFNEFLPDGYRIRMFDRSGYVIEYPDAVSGVARLTIAV